MTADNDTPAETVEKATEEVKETAEKVTDTPPEPVTETADKPVDDDINAKVDGLIETVNALTEQVSGLVAAPVSPEMPGDGEVITDASPVKGPWTHRNPFSRG